jgi:hypothetical protein
MCGNTDFLQQNFNEKNGSEGVLSKGIILWEPNRRSDVLYSWHETPTDRQTNASGGACFISYLF